MNFNCRFCNSPLTREVINLCNQPPSNSYLKSDDLKKSEITYPLKTYVCESCWLVQLPEHAKANQLFTDDYAYFSSTSASWCEHAEDFVVKAQSKLGLNNKSFVIELASNDGYLLQYLKKRNIPCLGIEPTLAAANQSRKKGIETISEFFGSKLAKKLIESSNYPNSADLIVANNVIAHVPDIKDFFEGISMILNKSGKLSIEFPHLLNLIKENQFDTIYHEHYSYLSLNVIQRIANNAGLYVEDVEELKTHGGSLRVWFNKNNLNQNSFNINRILTKEDEFGLETIHCYEDFQKRAFKVKIEFLDFLLEANKNKKNVFAYGAAAKGNTLLNYSGIKNDLIKGVVDKAKSKQGKFLPGSHIPIICIDELKAASPDYIIVFPWNLIEEIKKDLKGYKLITLIPEIKHWD